MSFSTKVVVALLLVCSVTQASKMVQNPLRARLNSNMVQDIFHKRDQDLLKVISNIELGSFDLSDAAIKSLKVSFEPAQGAWDDFDFNLSLDQTKYLGLSSGNIKFSGQGKLALAGQEETQDFTIEGPLSNFQLSFDVNSEAEEKILYRGLEVVLNQDLTQINSQSSALNQNAAQVKEWVQKRMVEEIEKIRKLGTLGNNEII